MISRQHSRILQGRAGHTVIGAPQGEGNNPEDCWTLAGDTIPGFTRKKDGAAGHGVTVLNMNFSGAPSGALHFFGSSDRGCYPRLISISPPGYFCASICGFCNSKK